jgi:hypothetical protein
MRGARGMDIHGFFRFCTVGKAHPSGFSSVLDASHAACAAALRSSIERMPDFIAQTNVPTSCATMSARMVHQTMVPANIFMSTSHKKPSSIATPPPIPTMNCQVSATSFIIIPSVVAKPCSCSTMGCPPAPEPPLNLRGQNHRQTLRCTGKSQSPRCRARGESARAGRGGGLAVSQERERERERERQRTSSTLGFCEMEFSSCMIVRQLSSSGSTMFPSASLHVITTVLLASDQGMQRNMISLVGKDTS